MRDCGCGVQRFQPQHWGKIRKIPQPLNIDSENALEVRFQPIAVHAWRLTSRSSICAKIRKATSGFDPEMESTTLPQGAIIST